LFSYLLCKKAKFNVQANIATICLLHYLGVELSISR